MEFLTVFGLGALTVLHPCPMGTNLGALSLLVGLQQGRTRQLARVAAFIAAEVAVYSILGMAVSFGGSQIASLANFLQTYFAALVGPVLILAGMMLAGLLLAGQSMLRFGEQFQAGLSDSGVATSFLLGVLIALSFCPMTAAVFFGVLVPMAISRSASMLYPALFGLGASLPLALGASLVSKGALRLSGSQISQKSAFPGKMRTVAGAALIVIGVALSVRTLLNL